MDEAAGLNVAVTGAGGFVGATLCPALAASGHQPVALPLRGAAEVRLAPRTEVVVHLAALAHGRGRSAEELRRVNVELAAKVGRAAAANGARMIFISTIKVHGEQSEAPFTETSPIAPRDAYAESKARAEEALRRIAGLRLTVLRPPLVYGPGVKANFRALMSAIAHGVPLPLAGVANRRSFLYAGNLADAVLCCMARTASTGRTYLLSDGAALSSGELCRRIGNALGRPARLFHLPTPMLEVLPGVRTLIRSLEADDTAIRRDLGWRPAFPQQDGMAATIAWFRRG